MTGHIHRPTYWNYLFHHDKTDPENRTGKHTLVCRHCGQPICKQRRTLPWWLLILLVGMYLLMLANEDFLRQHAYLMALPVALLLLTDYYDYRTKAYTLLEEHEEPQSHEDKEN